MLENLLRLVAEGGIHSYEELARQLSISQSLLEPMLEDLTRLGYLRPVAGDGQGQCRSCPIGVCAAAQHCSAGSGPGQAAPGPGDNRIWSLTDKGARTAARLSLG